MGEDFIAYLQDLFAGLGPVSARPMFGGHGLYHDGVIIGIVLDEALYLKADEETRDRFEAAGGVPCVYTGQAKPITMSYWSLPDEAMESPEAMLPWARLAYAAALRKPARRAHKAAAQRRPR